MPYCFAVFHTNLAFSAIPAEARAEVITRCYQPLLDVVETVDVPLGIEVSGWTLRQIELLAPDWISRFKRLIAADRCQLVGSGYSQLIGPLVPHHVNRWNQELGLACYQELLECRPKLAFVNEMAFSTSLAEIYRQAGYTGLVLSRENAHTPLPHKGPWFVGEDRSSALPALFGDAILFQKFQRLVHGDIEDDEYWDYLERWDHLEQARPVYCSDTEIFGYRPKRYHYEQAANDGEWTRVAEVFARLKQQGRFVSPEAALQTGSAGNLVKLTSTEHPITVKKQPKYNLARWAVSGKNDLYLNSLCHRLAQQHQDSTDLKVKEQVCRLWASDLRTHIHPSRLDRARKELEAALNHPKAAEPPARLKGTELPAEVTMARKGIYLFVNAPGLDFCLNLRRGLALRHLSFGGPALVGTLPHGYFHDISLGADFYSGPMVVELPGQLLRITDLEQMEPEISVDEGRVMISARLDTALGPLVKTLTFTMGQPSLSLRYDFPGWARPYGIVRVGHITLLPEAWQQPLTLTCHNGGPRQESFLLEGAVSHNAAVSSLISCTTGLGAVTGILGLSDGKQSLRLRWDPGQCAAFPMLLHQPCEPGHLTRLIFSLVEMDDTLGDAGQLLPFELHIDRGE